MDELEFPDPSVQNPTFTGGWQWWHDGGGWLREEPLPGGSCACKPRTDSIAPSEIEVLETVDLVITGENFFDGITNVSFSSNITINTVTVDSTNQMTVNVTAADSPAIVNVTVDNQGVAAYGTPLTVSISPDALTFSFIVRASNSSDQIILPLVDGYNYNFTIDWGDGTVQPVTSWNHANKSHYYPTGGDYHVVIDGLCEAWSFSNFTNSFDNKVIEVLSLGQVGWKSLNRAFYSCANMTSFSANNGDTSAVTDMYEMFRSCPKLTSVDLTGMDFSLVTGLAGWFFGNTAMTSMSWPTSGSTASGVTDISNMFNGCTSLTTVDWTNLDTSGVTNMGGLFEEALALTDPGLSTLDMTSCTSITRMFVGDYYSGPNFPTSAFDGWDTSNVQNFSYLFYDNGSIVAVDMSGLDMSSATSIQWMFDGCNDLTSVSLPQLNLTASGYAMFRDCYALTSLTVAPGSTWNVTNAGRMFQYCNNLATLDMHWMQIAPTCTSMLQLFEDCHDLTSLDLSHWDVSSITDMTGVFHNCISIVTIDTTGWDTSNVTTMSTTFRDCYVLVNLDLDHWNLESVTNMSQFMYRYGASLAWPTAKYDAALIAWSGQTLNSNISTEFSGIKYSPGAATTARNVLTSAPNSWTIIDGGQL